MLQELCVDPLDGNDDWNSCLEVYGEEEHLFGPGGPSWANGKSVSATGTDGAPRVQSRNPCSALTAVRSAIPMVDVDPDLPAVDDLFNSEVAVAWGKNMLEQAFQKHLACNFTSPTSRDLFPVILAR